MAVRDIIVGYVRTPLGKKATFFTCSLEWTVVGESEIESVKAIR